jgi:hypothetical protein
VPKSLREDVATLVRHHMVACDRKIKWARVARNRIRFGDDLLRDLYMHRMCDLSAKHRVGRQHMENVAAAERLRAKMAAEGVPSSPKDLEITGHDVMEAGHSGRKVGKKLFEVLDEVAVDPKDLKRTREWQLGRL